VSRATTIRQWDEWAVVPRFGFGSVAQYHAAVSVAPLLPQLSVPALYLGARADPIVPEHTVRNALLQRVPQLRVYWLDRGGHVGFPQSCQLGFPAAPGAESQVVCWLLQQTGSHT
jgi:uncharacterized protein